MKTNKFMTHPFSIGEKDTMNVPGRLSAHLMQRELFLLA